MDPLVLSSTSSVLDELYHSASYMISVQFSLKQIKFIHTFMITETCQIFVSPPSFKIYFILFIFGCIWSLLLCAGFLQLPRAGAALPYRARASHCSGFSCCGAQALGAWASVVVARGLSCSVACGIFPDQGSNPCPLHWQADS